MIEPLSQIKNYKIDSRVASSLIKYALRNVPKASEPKSAKRHSELAINT